MAVSLATPSTRAGFKQYRSKSRGIRRRGRSCQCSSKQYSRTVWGIATSRCKHTRKPKSLNTNSNDIPLPSCEHRSLSNSSSPSTVHHVQHGRISKPSSIQKRWNSRPSLEYRPRESPQKSRGLMQQQPHVVEIRSGQQSISSKTASGWDVPRLVYEAERVLSGDQIEISGSLLEQFLNTVQHLRTRETVADMPHVCTKSEIHRFTRTCSRPLLDAIRNGTPFSEPSLHDIQLLCDIHLLRTGKQRTVNQGTNSQIPRRPIVEVTAQPASELPGYPDEPSDFSSDGEGDLSDDDDDDDEFSECSSTTTASPDRSSVFEPDTDLSEGEDVTRSMEHVVKTNPKRPRKFMRPNKPMSSIEIDISTTPDKPMEARLLEPMSAKRTTTVVHPVRRTLADTIRYPRQKAPEPVEGSREKPFEVDFAPILPRDFERVRIEQPRRIRAESVALAHVASYTSSRIESWKLTYGVTCEG